MERAEELLDEISADYKKLSAERLLKPLQVQAERVDDVLGREWYLLRLPFDPPEPKERWGLLVGDAMHNTRSALDHLACRLVEHNGKDVNIRTAFPIWASEPKDKNERKRFRGAIAGMSVDHKKSLRKLQPYANPGSAEAEKLIALAALDNADKHQILVPLISTIGGERATPPSIQSDIAAEFDYIWNAGQLAVKGVELLRFSPRSPIGAIHNIDLPIPIRPTFGDNRTGLGDLREIRAYVVGIVESFAPELS
ncbi:MAG: hypothetical protein ACXVE1_04100 [Gaiellaceae bacterium]